MEDSTLQSQGGGGFDNKVFRTYSTCPDGSIGVESEIVVAKDLISATLVRRDCQILASPVSIPMSNLNFATGDSTILSMNGRVYDQQTSAAQQRVTLAFCRTETTTPQVQGLVWQVNGDPQALEGSVTENDGAGSGALRVQPVTIQDPKLFATTSGQSSHFILRLTSASSATLTYSLNSATEATVPTLTCATQVPPLYISSSLFGMHHHRHNGVDPLPASANGLNNIGSITTWGMEGLFWFNLNPARGTYEWSQLDRLLDQALLNGTDVTFTFGGVPEWATAACGNQVWDASGRYGCSNPPNNFQDWDDFVTAIVTHAAGRIKYWGMWNEPENTTYWTGDTATMVTLARRAHLIIKALDPKAIIVSPAPSSEVCTRGTYTGPACWLNDYFSAGGKAYTDIVAFHAWPSAGGAPEEILGTVSSLRGLMDSYGLGGQPIWDSQSSDCGIPVSDRPAYVARFLLMHMSATISRHYWYAWDNTSCGELWHQTSGLNPSGIAYWEIYRWTVGSTLVNGCTADTQGNYICEFRRDNGSRALVLWNPAGVVNYVIPAGFTKIRDLSGTTTPLAGPAIPTSGRPILLE